MKMVDKHLLCALAASMLAIGGARASPVTAMVTGDAVSALHLGITAHLAGPSEAGHDGIVHRVDADRLLAASSHDE